MTANFRCSKLSACIYCVFYILFSHAHTHTHQFIQSRPLTMCWGVCAHSVRAAKKRALTRWKARTCTKTEIVFYAHKIKCKIYAICSCLIFLTHKISMYNVKEHHRITGNDALLPTSTLCRVFHAI